MIDATLLLDLLLCSAGVVAVWAACLALTYHVRLYDPKDGSKLESPTWAQRLEVADIMFALPFYVLIFVLAAIATLELRGDPTSRWHGVTFSSYWFQMLYVARMTTHCPIQWIVLRHDPTLRLQMTAHHVLSIISYGGGLVTTRMHFFANMDGCCEFTTVFLNFVFAFKWFSPKDDDLYFVAKAFMGVMLWVGFVVFRLVLFPVWLWWFYMDATNHTAQTWDRVTGVERYFYAAVTSFLLLISCFWFVPITKGLLKALGLTKKKKTEKKN